MTQTEKIHTLQPKVVEADPELVEFLEQVIERVKSGKTKGYLIMEQDAGSVNYSCMGLNDRFRIIGLLHNAIHKLHVGE